MVTATYKVRTHNGRTVKMTGAIEDLDKIIKAMQRATVTSALLAIAEKLDALQRQFEFYSMGNKMPGNDLYSGLLMEIVNKARTAIAATRGENGAIVPTPRKESTSLAAKEIEMIVAADTETDPLWD